MPDPSQGPGPGFPGNLMCYISFMFDDLRLELVFILLTLVKLVTICIYMYMINLSIHKLDSDINMNFKVREKRGRE